MKHLVAALTLVVLSLTSAGGAGRYEAAWPHTDFERHSVPLSEINSGGPGKDGIPSIDDPRFVDVSRASTWIDPDEPVVLLTSASTASLYPRRC